LSTRCRSVNFTTEIKTTT